MKFRSWQKLETTGMPDFSDGLQGENGMEEVKSQRLPCEIDIIHPQ